MGTQIVQLKGSLVGLVLPVQEIFVLPWLLWSAHVQIFFPHCTVYTISILSSWAGSRSGSLSISIVSLCLGHKRERLKERTRATVLYCTSDEGKSRKSSAAFPILRGLYENPRYRRFHPPRPLCLKYTCRKIRLIESYAKCRYLKN
jgi:hypothetical protein